MRDFLFKAMQSTKDKLMSNCYEIYSKDHEITYDEFWDKVMNDEEFGKYFDDVLWKQAVKQFDRKPY